MSGERGDRMPVSEHEDAIETLGALVSEAGGRGADALDVFKDTVAEKERLRDALWKVVNRPTTDGGRFLTVTFTRREWKAAKDVLDA